MIEIIRQDSKKIKVTIKDGNDPYDITGGTVFFTVNQNGDPENDDDAVIRLKTGDPQVVVIDAEQGRVDINLTSNDTDISPRRYYYDVQLVDAVGNVVSRKRDTFSVNPDITRSLI